MSRCRRIDRRGSERIRFTGLRVGIVRSWEPMRREYIDMKPILVTGATGRVGRHVVSQLLAEGTKVRALSRNPDKTGLPHEVEVVRGDLTMPETLKLLTIIQF